MKIIKTNFSGLNIIKLKKNIDNRGFLKETFKDKNFSRSKLIFDYCVFSKENILRGFHFQYKYKQAKYIFVLKGKILDCVVDLRKNSKTFSKTFKIILSEKNLLGLYVPAGFAHSYMTLEKSNLVYYKLSNYYKPEFESGIIWNDRDLKINWPNKKPIISKKDRNLPTFENFQKKFKYL